MTRANELPPFVVELYDGDTLLSRSEFANHDDATALAVETLRAIAPATE